MSSSSKRSSTKERSSSSKRQRTDSTSTSRPTSLMEKLNHNRSTFKCIDGLTTGPCVLCDEVLSLSWYDWKLHLMNHTGEREFHCSHCNSGVAAITNHTSCPAESITNIFGNPSIGSALDGFICQICDYFQINDHRLFTHWDEKHSEVSQHYDTHIARVTLLPDMQPKQHIIQTDLFFVPLKERYRCGAGHCIFHGKTFSEYSEHLYKAHSVFKTFFCPHCKLMINRAVQPTVAIQKVLEHTESHGGTFHQCYNCDLVSPSEVILRRHLLNVHPLLPIQFWRNAREDDVINSELISIQLDCTLCGERLTSTSSGIDHYQDEHPKCYADFKVLKHIKTTSDAKVICSKHDSTLYFSEVLVCGLCDENFEDKHQWIEHVLQCHRSEPLIVKREFKWIERNHRRKNAEFDKDMLFYCIFCDEGNDDVCFKSSIDDVYSHWTHRHKPDNKPFQFGMAELVACFYCEMMSTFHGLREHISREHPGDPFVPVKAFTQHKQCALCNHVLNEQDDHYQTKHSLATEANVLNPIPITKVDLSYLLQVRVHQKVTCEYCDQMFDTRDLYRIHHNRHHTKSEKMSHLKFDKDSITLIGDCCQSEIEPNAFHNHLAFHKYEIKCDVCNFNTDNAFRYMCHHAENHQASETIADLYLNFLRLRYWRSVLVFGNGLVINNFNAQGTGFDFANNFERFASRLVAAKIEEYTAINDTVKD